MKKRRTSHCCKLIEKFLEDPRINIYYSPKFREYVTHLLNSPAKQCYFYCPWCGKKLPDSLRDEYFESLEKEYGIDDPFDKKQAKQVPEEFKSDEWWKKRGLS